ncbi:hypothetical protein G7046_g4583 [Stylonectria norvegica]|nr:hypothetical protein G7046_g4583 [Stylonectria norvegica]
MAHIASCVAEVDASYIQKPVSPRSPNELTIPTATTEEKQFPWRMQQPEPQRKYQLFPRDRQLPVLNSGRCLDPEKAFAVAMAQNSDKSDKQQSTVAGLRIRINQHNLIRRRKVSVPELGPMTTVQEVAMDSPTIPGRPPVHERSISAPGNSLRTHPLAETFLYTPTADNDGANFSSAIEQALQASSNASIINAQKRLPPLIIPGCDSPIPQLRQPHSSTQPSRGSDNLRPAETLESPQNRTQVLTPNTAVSNITTPGTASSLAMSCATLPTPVSAPITESRTSSPRFGDRRCATPVTGEGASSALGHRRGASESSSIMDRGRPRKRPEVRNNNGPLLKSTDSKRSKSSDKRAFEQLPKGYRPRHAAGNIESLELAALQKQAFGQAERFEVLKAADVELLSKELRYLDERSDYLRRTYTSLRAGRRNLHSRICQYLRSPRAAKFSHESMLKQEEALAELDASIDDLILKLEKADNRRTRVRQKLLEHVAAAACLAASGTANAYLPPQQSIGTGPASSVGTISTPPRSPTKQSFTFARATSSSPSPQRVVAQVPSTILEQPLGEDAANLNDGSLATGTASLKRSDVESIRIYAGDDVYTLLADVEKEITRMSVNAGVPEADMSEKKRIEHHRQKSHEMLNDMMSSTNPLAVKKSFNKTTTTCTSAPIPPLKDDAPAEEGLILLTNAVFKP